MGYPRSLPALWGEAIAPSGMEVEAGEMVFFADADLVPAYRLGAIGSTKALVARLAETVALLAERLSRLEEAYHAWQPFEPGPYFDLYPPQVMTMCHWQEQGGQVHFTLYGDWLVPAFRQAVEVWSRQRLLARRLTRAARGEEMVSPAVVQAWAQEQRLFWQRCEEAWEVVGRASRLLYDSGNVDFLSSHAALDERNAVAARYGQRTAVVLSQLRDAPTLTMARTFSVEPRCQPGRRQRLARQRLLPQERRF